MAAEGPPPTSSFPRQFYPLLRPLPPFNVIAPFTHRKSWVAALRPP